MSTIVCCDCGIQFVVPENWHRKRLEDKRTFWCPNGHQQAYVKSKVDKLAEELSRARQQLAQKDDEIQKERDRVYQVTETLAFRERQLATTKGVVTKLKKRAVHGVCPCCNRTFENLSRHMATKHPQFLAEELPGEGTAKH